MQKKEEERKKEKEEEIEEKEEQEICHHVLNPILIILFSDQLLPHPRIISDSYHLV